MSPADIVNVNPDPRMEERTGLAALDPRQDITLAFDDRVAAEQRVAHDSPWPRSLYYPDGRYVGNVEWNESGPWSEIVGVVADLKSLHPQPESVPSAIDAWLKSLIPVPSPYLEKGRVSGAALRGRRLFMSERIGCAGCHPPPLFTDDRTHDVGTASRSVGLWGKDLGDQPTDKFDTPALTELWRSAPYLHDGSSPDLRDLFTRKNPHDAHGATSSLSPSELDDLIAYLLSL